jgi:hypothetical protein
MREMGIRHRWQRLGKQRTSYYTNGTRNASMDGNGNLAITAIRETLPKKNRCWQADAKSVSQ